MRVESASWQSGRKRGAEAPTWPGGAAPCRTHYPLSPAPEGLGGSWANYFWLPKAEELLHKDASEAAW